MTTIVADTGEVAAIQTLKPVDATTNPSLLLKASQLPQCEPMIAEAISYAKEKSSDKQQQIEDAADKLAVLVGLEILKHIPGRISSFFGNELIVGSFFLSFATIYIATIAKFSKTNVNLKLIFLIIFLISLSFLIGERSNFIKFFLISIFLLFFVIKLSIKIKIFSSLAIFCILFLSLNFFQDIQYRYYKQHIENFQIETEPYFLNKRASQNILIDTKENIINFIKWSKYGAHYNAAYKIFLENPYFGVGIKHFRNESIKEKYRNEEYKWTDERNTTHPHQIHFEFLSETGLFGYTIFIIFITASLYLSIKNYLIHKNLFQLVTILYVLVSILPLLPSGSFFSTYSSSLFWLNYAIMVSYIKKIKS